MAIKRKLDSTSASASEPAKKQQQKPEPAVEEPPPETVAEAADEDEEHDEEEEEEEEEEEVEEEYEEEEEVEEEEEEAVENQTAPSTDPANGGEEDANNNHDDDDVDEPIEALLEPFSKDQIVNLLKEAAESHRDVADRIRRVADEDPIHRKIFVHGLGWDTTAETLTSVFAEYGEIEDCKAVLDKASGKSKGYGFILFESRSGARKALKQPQKKIGNRMTACQFASLGPAAFIPNAPLAAAVAAAAPPASEYTQRKIYVSNVGAELDPQKLLGFFTRFGEIEEGPLGLDKATGRPKGFCLFVYKSADSVKRALEEPHKNFDGHMLHCQRAIDGPKPVKGHYGNQHHHNNRNKNLGGFSGGAPAMPGHLMAPGGAAGIGFNPGAASSQALNPALGQALALLATQGAGLNIFGGLGAQGVNPGGAHVLPGGYGNQPSIGAYGNQAALPGGYPNPQLGQGGTGRGSHGYGQYGGPPYTGR